MVQAPESTGLGFRLIQSMLSYSLNDIIEIRFHQKGVVADFLGPTISPTVRVGAICDWSGPVV